jgi:hypothetical protein
MNLLKSLKRFFMPTFKVGDRIRMTQSCGYQQQEIDDEYVVRHNGSELIVGDPDDAWCSCQSKWELLKPTTIETMRPGTIIFTDMSGTRNYRRVLACLGGEGDLQTFIVSDPALDRVSRELNLAHNLQGKGNISTIFSLRENGWQVFEEEKMVEMTVAEISKKLGVTVKVVE